MIWFSTATMSINGGSQLTGAVWDSVLSTIGLTGTSGNLIVDGTSVATGSNGSNIWADEIDYGNLNVGAVADMISSEAGLWVLNPTGTQATAMCHNQRLY